MAGRSGGGIQVPSHFWVADFGADAAGDFVRLYVLTANSNLYVNLPADAQLSAGTRLLREIERRDLDFNLRHATSTTIPLSAGLGKVWKLSHGVAINGSVAGEWMVYRQFAPRTEQFT
jgi:hypothetical protein